MIALLYFVLAVLAAPFKSKSRLEAENAALRHQLIVLRRKMQGRVRLTNSDRWFLIQLYRWFPSILQVVTIVQPETLIRWHRAGCTENLIRVDEVSRESRPARHHRDTAVPADPAEKHLPPSFKPPRRSVVAGTDWGAATRLVSTTAAVLRRYVPRSRQPSFDRPARPTSCPG